ncbi:MAG: purine-nucleoside phosphorylase [Acidimicrobiia bacterium]|jgi:purine-nucleoside phosphorylase
MTYELLQDAARTIAARTGVERHHAAVVLGSGLGDYATHLPAAVTVPYADIPHFPQPQVTGHAGTVSSVDVEGKRALLFSGRVHTYEGWGLSEVVFGVRAAAMAGCHTVLLTNAAGCLGGDLLPGDLVAIRDHLNLTSRNPLLGGNDDRLGPRFPDLTDAYDAGLRRRIAATCEELGRPYKEGVYAWFLGPSYETPAEIEMVRRLGGTLVGMSTVPEVIALRHMGVRVGAISLATNYAAGITGAELSHAEVTAAAATAHDDFTALVDALLPVLVEEPD